MKNSIKTTCTALLLAAFSNLATANNTNFQHLVIEDDALKSTHGLKYKIQADKPFKLIKPKHRKTTFTSNNNTFEISLSAFISPKATIMIHAETDANATGSANYTNKPLANWPNKSFRSSGPACITVPKEEVKNEHDLSWLRSNGFEPSGNLMFAQYFATTDDFNHEVVVSVIVPVPSCKNPNEQTKALEKVQRALTLSKL